MIYIPSIRILIDSGGIFRPMTPVWSASKMTSQKHMYELKVTLVNLTVVEVSNQFGDYHRL